MATSVYFGDYTNLLSTIQNFHRPKCPGLLALSVAPTHSSLRKTTIFKIAEQKVKTPHKMATDLDCLTYLTE